MLSVNKKPVQLLRVSFLYNWFFKFQYLSLSLSLSFSLDSKVCLTSQEKNYNTQLWLFFVREQEIECRQKYR